MRISSTLFFQTGLNSINAQQADLVHLFRQIGTGQRMVAPSDDPLAAAEAINVAQAESLTARLAENRQVAKSNLGAEENVLNSLTTQMWDLKTRLVEVGNGTLSDADRLTLANVLKEARTNLLGLANATDGNGQYLFSGSMGDKPAFDETSYDFLGDTRNRDIQVEQTRRMSGSDNGNDIFARATPGVTTFLTNGVGGNAGTAIVGNPVVYDVTTMNGNYGYEIKFTSATDYEVTVTDLDTNTPVILQQAGTINPGGGDQTVQLPHGVQIKLSGIPEANNIFEVKPAAHEDMNLFQTLDKMIQALELPQAGNSVNQAQFQSVLNATMQRIDVNYDNILTVRSSVGARLAELDSLDEAGALKKLSYRAELSRLEDLDYYSASSQLELRRVALEAASLAFKKIQSTSMFNINHS